MWILADHSHLAPDSHALKIVTVKAGRGRRNASAGVVCVACGYRRSKGRRVATSSEEIFDLSGEKEHPDDQHDGNRTNDQPVLDGALANFPSRRTLNAQGRGVRARQNDRALELIAADRNRNASEPRAVRPDTPGNCRWHPPRGSPHRGRTVASGRTPPSYSFCGSWPSLSQLVPPAIPGFGQAEKGRRPTARRRSCRPCPASSRSNADPMDEFFDISSWLTAIVGSIILFVHLLRPLEFAVQ